MQPGQQNSSSPIRIGYCLSLSGAVGGNGRAARLAHQIWLESINARGGLLGRPVELLCYDDGSDAANVEALYRRLMDEDKVDLVIGGYGTNTLLPAMPLMMERQRFFVGLMGLGVNNELAYENYFAMIPTGSDPNAALTESFFELAAQQKPRPLTAALLSADAAFSRNPIRGAKKNAAKYGFKVVHEAVYPLSTKDFKPVMDAVAASQCDLLFICSYLQDSIDLVKAVHAHSYRPKMVGASMIGPQNALVKAALGPLLNGFVNYEYWVPVSAMRFPGVDEMLSIYRTRAVGQDVDPLGHYMAPTAYAQMQVLEQAVQGTGGLNDATLSAYARATPFDTVMGKVRFGVHGEWTEPRVVQVQYQGIDSADPMQFLDEAKQVVVSPASLRSGKLIYPYTKTI
ncbi:branched-chain amino acid ABC transporter substrate-binding protein [Massilia sp. Root418]|uniref:amino acid ABC transporter substrate-binding protein n=1 Tax=Massilia sp. Root418 TaxID=1736532 RepID=UPI0006FC908F|nr:amino acid ABC transporter substrate-binding protein [Massilia sp. Root418]KQW97152.1 branched-chain amino acid ABC transporter substrate-binding protein [Massilia sp. Root418]